MTKRARRAGLDEAYEDVRDFQVAFGNPVGTRPAALAGREKARRLEWLREELDELAAAETVEDQADALIDLMYFAVGYLVEMGVPPSGVWRAVHSANMAKLWPDGAHFTAAGKVSKPDGWRGPEEAIRQYVAGLEKEADGDGAIIPDR